MAVKVGRMTPTPVDPVYWHTENTEMQKFHHWPVNDYPQNLRDLHDDKRLSAAQAEPFLCFPCFFSPLRYE
jgi:hypothetical protein